MAARHARTRAPSRHTAVLVLVGMAIAFGAVVAGLSVSSPYPAVPKDPWLVPGPLVVDALHVVRCPTSYGIPRARDVDLPTTVRAQVAASLAPTLSVFTDGLGTLDVVAPSTWGCTALDGVGGSSSLIVYPPGVPRPSWGHVTAVGRGIEASQTGSCAGCSLEVACPLFAAARREYVATYREPCRRAASPDELRADVSPSRVLFVDPPDVLGAGQPSGGALAAYGAMLWRLPGARRPAAWLDTCTLPASDRELCVLSIDAFLSRHPDDAQPSASTTQSMQAVSAATSSASMAGNSAMRSWLRPSLR